MPVARPRRAKLMKKMATAVRTFRKGVVPRKSFETRVSTSARVATGTKPVQNFDHRNERMGTGAVRTIQKAGPSEETAGKTKRTATADSTKDAIPRFTKA